MIKSIRRMIGILATLFVISAFSACDRIDNSTAGESGFTNSRCKYIEGPVREADARFKGRSSSQWAFCDYETELNGEFVRALSIIADRVILGTANGSVWALENERLQKLSSIPEYEIAAIDFQTPMVGIVLARRLTKGDAQTSNVGSIFRTEDGGKTWMAIQEITGVIFERVVSESSSFWAIGRKIANESGHSSHLLLVSQDNGSTWKDISDPLSLVASQASEPVNDYLTNVKVGTDGSIEVLSLRGRIYERDDRTGSWTLAAWLPDEPPQTGLTEFGMTTDGCHWIAGGSMGDEGSWGVIASQTEGGPWQRFRLHGFYFEDVTWSGNEVIAVGARDSSRHLDGSNHRPEFAFGGISVVLLSDDKGRSWESVYETDGTRGLTTIRRIDDSRYLIITESGRLIQLGRSKCRS